MYIYAHACRLSQWRKETRLLHRNECDVSHVIFSCLPDICVVSYRVTDTCIVSQLFDDDNILSHTLC
jgi:hypothetical protein